MYLFIFQHFTAKILKQKVKEFYSKHPDVHYLNPAINILLYLFNHISIHIDLFLSSSNE